MLFARQSIDVRVLRFPRQRGFFGHWTRAVTVEPYQNVDGCSVAKPSPNGALVDSTADVLSHELIETITDPDGDAWWITNDLDLFFAEIGDVCQNATFDYAVSNLPGRNYEIQPEYSNQAHACVYTPPK